MNGTITPTLSEQQIADYHEDGYVIVRNALSAKEADELRRVVQKQVKRDAYPSTLKYPEPAKYTVSGNRLADPGLTADCRTPDGYRCRGICTRSTRTSHCIRRVFADTR